MNPEREQLLSELAAFGREYDATKSDRRERLRNLEPESARLLWLVARLMRARDVLELGTSNGYSTIWLADAVSETGGRVTTVEIDADRAGMAELNLTRAGLDDRVALHVGDAGPFLAASPSERWDLIFLDAERPHYVDYWPDLFSSLRPLGLLAVDNVLSHADELVDFRRLVDGSARVVSAVAPTGAGLLLTTKEPQVEAK